MLNERDNFRGQQRSLVTALAVSRRAKSKSFTLAERYLSTTCTTSGKNLSRQPTFPFTLNKTKPSLNEWPLFPFDLGKNRPFPSSLELLFQSKSLCKSFVMVISSAFHMSENLIFISKTRFEIEARTNSKMAYCMRWFFRPKLDIEWRIGGGDFVRRNVT